VRVLGAFGWSVVALATALSALAVIALTRLPLVPPPMTPLSGGSSDFVDWNHYRDTRDDRVLVTVAASDGVLALGNSGAYRISRDLRVQRYAWPGGVRVEQVRSLAWNRGTLAVAYGFGFFRDQQEGVLVIARDRVAHFPQARESHVTGLHARGGGFTGFLVEYEFDPRTFDAETRLTAVDVDLDGVRPSGPPRAFELPGRPVDTITWIDGVPKVIVGEKSWTLEPLDGEAPTEALPGPVWSAGALDTHFRDEHGQFLDERGRARPIDRPRDREPLRFCVEENQLAPLELLSRDTSAEVRCGARSLAVGWPASRIGRLWAGALDGPRHDVASYTYVSSELTAQPIDGAWLLLDDLRYRGEGALVGDDGARLDHPPVSTGMTHARHPSWFWLALLALLVVFPAATSIAIAAAWLRARRWRLPRRAHAEVGVPGIFAGVLHRDQAGEESVAIGAHDVRLTPGYRLLVRSLDDGAPVFVVGRVEETAAGDGPFRGAAERRFVPDGPRYAVGSDHFLYGSPLPMPGRAALRWLLAAHLVIGVLVLIRFGFGPLFW